MTDAERVEELQQENRELRERIYTLEQRIQGLLADAEKLTMERGMVEELLDYYQTEYERLAS